MTSRSLPGFLRTPEGAFGAAALVAASLCALAAPLIEHEQRWLPILARRLPLPVPVPRWSGVAGEGFPWAWSVVAWFDGTTAAATPPTQTAPAPAPAAADGSTPAWPYWS